MRISPLLPAAGLLACLLSSPVAAQQGEVLRARTTTLPRPTIFSPEPIECDIPHEPRIRLLFTGDIMQHLPQVEAARRPDGEFDYDTSLACVKPLFDEADLVVVNLETTLTDSENYAGYPCFRSPEALVGALRRAGVDVCVLANNHCCDGGGRGVRTTLAALERCGIAHTGVFVDSAELAQRHPLYLNVRDVHLALLNYTYGTNGIPTPKGMYVNRIDTAAMALDLRAAKDAGAECIVVCIHWGDEYERQPNATQRTLASFLRLHGADLVVGSHPHVVQPVEADSTGGVFFSLGNFVSNQRKRYCDGGIVGDVVITIPPDGHLAYDVRMVPVWVETPSYRILTPAAADTAALTPCSRALLDRFIADTRAMLDPKVYKQR